MKRLYLHIGSHKTGSSSIQKALYDNLEAVNAADYDFFYNNPDGSDAKTGNTSSWILGDELVHDDLFSGYGAKVCDYKKLAIELNKSKFSNMIMSAENFSWVFKEEEIVKLKNELSKYFEVKIIIYIRRQDKLLVSHMQQSSKGLRFPAFGYYKGGSKALPNRRENYDEYLDYYLRVTKWSNVFGKSNMIIRVLEPNYLVGGDTVLDFLNCIGLTSAEIKPVRVNESLGFEHTKVGHLMNEAGIDEGVIRTLINSSLESHGKLLPCKEQAEEVYKRYLKSNEMLNEAFQLCDKNKAIFDSDFSMYPDLPQDIWTEDRANAVITSIISRLNRVSLYEIIKLALYFKIKKIKNKIKGDIYHASHKK
ncbi:hypothetical protein ACPV5L_07370 [Vibrio astriarenae]